ncbi:phage tail protein [Bradyrhizobium sp. CCBAU 53421]|uniref:phage tail protein n=1 Tax=Bradyrhizobium sp. CCBAU 53421 TaxID=1325120 RepID=UPI00188CCB89|nr:tail fiber protein [Bradyrhizobium sp. CCBAU 53421]QOZ30860.1 phage tail protein [Bradyrhizobium sp. CCBAU 53421]
MADPFVAEIRIFPFNFAPKGWAFCNGQLVPISQNTALFSLLGTTYGGNGTSNFALPNMQGNAPLAPGQGPGLSLYDLGESGGSDTVTLLQSELASHPHNMMAINLEADQAAPTPTRGIARSVNGAVYVAGTPTPTLVQMSPDMIGLTGSGLPHNNLMPYLTLSFCIALQGVYPPRS